MAAEVVGRFAPSPTGPLHLGSLVAALASYCSAHAQSGQWLIRIDNIDPPREQVGAIELILDALAAHGLRTPLPVIYQHDRLIRYRAILEQLIATDQAYACACSRAQLQSAGLVDCLGPCRDGHLNHRHGLAWRARCGNDTIVFDDLLYGQQHETLAATCGDFVLWRRDGLPAYQLATVVDDHEDGISEVVRGDDLLDNTARQCWLFDTLHWPRPAFMHLPVLRNTDGQKLSKQSHAPALKLTDPAGNVRLAMSHLGLNPPSFSTSLEGLLATAIEQWHERYHTTRTP